MPGQATAWVAAYPELASAPGPYTVEHRFGVFDPALDPTREETYAFIDNFLGEMSMLFPDEYVHVGGDENEGNQWMRSTSIQSFMKTHDLTDAPALQAYFAQRVQSLSPPITPDHREIPIEYP